MSMVFLGFGYSLVPAAMWPSVPKLVPAKVLGTAYALIYWIQNLGLMLFKMFAGNILAGREAAPGAVAVEIMFVTVCVIALLLSIGLRRGSAKKPELRLDAPSGK